MLKKTMTFENYDGVQVTKDFYFNLTKAEIMELEFGTVGGLGETIKKITAANDTPAMIELFKKIILKSYGEKTEDGMRLRKSPEISQAFSETEAYSDLFIELATDADAASKFINSVVPKVDTPSIPAPADK